jgi:ZIP family zinc transporter
MDGVPESAAIGINLLGGRGVSWAMVSAVFLSNVPEALSAATKTKRAGYSTLYVLGPWGGSIRPPRPWSRC